MRRLLLTMLALAMIGTAGAETASVLCTPGDSVNVRARPSKHSDAVGRFECGDTFETDGQKRKDSQGRMWVHMIDSALDTEDAWICETYVQYSPVEVDTETAVVDAKGRVAVRNAPGGKRTKWLKNGSQVNVLACSDEWAVTDQGYVAISCLLFKGGED